MICKHGRFTVFPLHFGLLGRDFLPVRFKTSPTSKAWKKNFGSGQLIFENWSGGQVDFFLTTT